MLRFLAACVLFVLVPACSGEAQSSREITCESRSDRYAECPIPENSQVRLVRTLSSTPCTPGRTYGAERTRIWVRGGCRGVFEATPGTPSEPEPPKPVAPSYLVRCESTRNAPAECPVDPSAPVTLVKQRSAAACTEGQTWGRLGGSVFVSRGCRAEFAVTPPIRPAGFPRPTNTMYWVTCESADNLRFECRIGEQDVPRVVRQLGRTACTEGTTWGRQDGILWVDRGCRAEFEVKRVR